MAKENKALAPVEPTDVALVASDELLEAEAGAGSEAVRPEDQAIPFLRILQALSPQLKRTNAGYCDGAQEGDIFNTVDQTVWSGSDGVLVVPCYFRPTLIEWRPRERGGGFVRSVDAVSAEGIALKNSTTRADDGRLYLPTGNTVIETAQHYVLQVSESGEFLARALIAMSSTQLKVSRQWITMREQQVGRNSKGDRFVLPSYACVYRLRTVAQRNEKGEFFNWAVGLERRATVEEIGMARAFYAGVKAGEVRHADHDSDETVTVQVHSSDIL